MTRLARRHDAARVAEPLDGAARRSKTPSWSARPTIAPAAPASRAGGHVVERGDATAGEHVAAEPRAHGAQRLERRARAGCRRVRWRCARPRPAATTSSAPGGPGVAAVLGPALGARLAVAHVEPGEDAAAGARRRATRLRRGSRTARLPMTTKAAPASNQRLAPRRGRAPRRPPAPRRRARASGVHRGAHRGGGRRRRAGPRAASRSTMCTRRAPAATKRCTTRRRDRRRTRVSCA